MDCEKKYKEALERAKKWYYAPNADKIPTYANKIISEIFPELKENEDEMIRKWIKKELESKYVVDNIVNNLMADKAFAWLEKQGELKEKPTKDQVWDYCNKISSEWWQITMGKWNTLIDEDKNKYNQFIGFNDFSDTLMNITAGALFQLIDTGKLEYEEGNLLLEKPDDTSKSLEVINEKQGEHKPTDEVKPKFNVGDWVIRSAEGFKHNTYLVTEVKGYYVCEDLKGRRVTFIFDDVHKNFKLWTIQDAEDGDVLVSHECLVIFREIDGLNIKCFCTYHYMNYEKFYVNTLHNKTAFYPATKEQRDLFFQKMKEAGYEWDAEKKELRKIDTRKNLILGGDLMQADCMVVEQDSALENRNVSPLLYGVIDSKKREIFLKRLEELYNILGIDTELNTPDYLLAEFTLNCLVSYGNAITKNIEKGYIKTLKF